MTSAILKISPATDWLKLPELALIAGDVACLHGESGAGKSRLLRALCDLDSNDLELRLDGAERCAIPAPQWRKQLQYLPAEPVWWTETAAELIEPKWQTAAQTLGLNSEHLNKPITQLSTGERQRAALLRALSAEPRVLLLDEPTAALDNESTREVENLLLEWVAERPRAIVWVSHSAEQRQRIGTRQWQIKNGALQCQ